MRQLCGFLGGSNGDHKDKKKVVHRRQVQMVELRVRMDCQRCEREVKKALSGMRGWWSPCPSGPMHCTSFSLHTCIVSMTPFLHPDEDSVVRTQGKSSDFGVLSAQAFPSTL